MARYMIVKPGVEIRDHGSTLAAYVDWRNGEGPKFRASIPTDSEAAYQADRDHGRAQAQREAEEIRDDILALYPTGFCAAAE
jgi:hypothetical protein